MLGDLGIDALERFLFCGGRKGNFIPMLDCTCIGRTKSLSALENCRECVVVRLEDRIKFVIMASNATESHSQERFADRVELLVHCVHDQLLTIWLGKYFGTKHQETGAGFGFAIAIGDQITRELLDNERIDRFV